MADARPGRRALEPVVTGVDELARRCADRVAELVARAVAERGRCSLALSGGPTPEPMVAELATRPLPWADVVVVQVDERVVRPGDRRRNVTMLARALGPVAGAGLRPVPVHAGAEAAARRYDELLVALLGDPPVLDVVVLGLGADGHTASLVPGDPVLEVDDRAVAATGPYQGTRRVTCTVGTLAAADRLVWMVSGPAKADAVAALVRGDPSIPAGLVPAERAELFVDEPAAGLGWRG